MQLQVGYKPFFAQSDFNIFLESNKNLLKHHLEKAKLKKKKKKEINSIAKAGTPLHSLLSIQQVVLQKTGTI